MAFCVSYRANFCSFDHDDHLGDRFAGYAIRYDSMNAFGRVGSERVCFISPCKTGNEGANK